MRPVVMLCTAILALVLAPGARAGGLVQVTLEGEIQAPGGALVEVGIDAWAADGPRREVRTRLHLAYGTTAEELAVLVHRRLLEAGVDVVSPEPSDDAEIERAHLFVERVVGVHLALGNGLSGIVTCCEGPPSLVRVEAPRGAESTGNLWITATTMHGHTQALGRSTLEVELAAGMSSAQISDQLFKRALASKWVSERPGTDAWSPMAMSDGAQFTGLSIELRGQTDWRLTVQLPDVR